ncbi:hypothetical protein HWV00_21065 (plasmid) [Moritella sp. 24]|uniref:hypothetical protein n=1 Tax=Moritella sp. 24 TaxID=2746230 RepID=UPI001BABFA50|nr:hypothetical protein [Moritella sp. 24]QUM78766.1 hypothetical protein HWV00_21065 [Moritella sp. 24]
MSKKTDWLKHCKRFLQNGSTPAEQRDYAERHLLNYNTFRKRLAAYKKSDTYKRSLAATETVHAKIRGGKAKAKREIAESQIPKEMTRGARVAKPMPAAHPGIKYNQNGTRSFRPGNRVALLHAEFLKGGFRSRNYESRGKVGIDENLELLNTQFATIHDTGAELIHDLEARYKDNDPIVLKEMNATGKVVERELSLAEARIEIAQQTAMPMTEIFKVMLAGEVKLAELELKDRDAPMFSKFEQYQITKEIIQQRIDEKLTAGETCSMFLLAGVEPPSILSREYEIELRNAEAEPPSDDGITPDQASELKNHLVQRNSDTPDWLAKRRAENARVYAESAGVGDELITHSEEVEDSET